MVTRVDPSRIRRMSPREVRRLFGLVLQGPPEPKTPSHAMQEAREAMRRRDEEWRQWDRDAAIAVAKKRAAERLAQLRSDVEKFGSEAVEVLRRRDNPQFELPEELRGLEPSTERE